MREGYGSELRAFFNENGEVDPPEIFRGVKTHGVRDDLALLGPVQPNGKDQTIVDRWPQQVFEACCEIAGVDLPRDTLQAVWGAVA